MTFDPFADPEGDEDFAIQGWDAVDNEQTTDKKETVVVQNNSEGKVVVTLKGGAGYDAPWIVVHAEDVADATSTLKDVDSLKELMTTTKNAAQFFSGGNKPAAPVAAPAQAGKPQGASEAPGGEKRYCSHGEMVFKSGVSKAGKPYQLFGCTAPRDQQCKAQFLN